MALAPTQQMFVAMRKILDVPVQIIVQMVTSAPKYALIYLKINLHWMKENQM